MGLVAVDFSWEYFIDITSLCEAYSYSLIESMPEIWGLAYIHKLHVSNYILIGKISYYGLDFISMQTPRVTVKGSLRIRKIKKAYIQCLQVSKTWEKTRIFHRQIKIQVLRGKKFHPQVILFILVCSQSKKSN